MAHRVSIRTFPGKGIVIVAMILCPPALGSTWISRGLTSMYGNSTKRSKYAPFLSQRSAKITTIFKTILRLGENLFRSSLYLTWKKPAYNNNNYSNVYVKNRNTKKFGTVDDEVKQIHNIQININTVYRTRSIQGYTTETLLEVKYMLSTT